MKNTTEENIAISDIIANVLGITFRNNEFPLGKWGEADNFCEISDGILLLLECEKGQKHPNTNVLKLYPYLEENPDKTIVLFHYFYPENKAPKNRLILCDFIASKMENSLKDRFKYVSLKCERNYISEKLRQQKKGLMRVLLTDKVRLNTNNFKIKENE